MFTSSVRRYGAALVGGVLALTLAPSAQAHDADRVPKAIGAGWLNGRLDDGLLHAAYDGGSGPVSYADYGGTVEAAYALAAVGRTRLLPRITGALEDTVDSYITGADFGSPDDLYAGPTGKLLAFVSDLGGEADPTSFGGTDLVARMEALTGEDGRIADVSSFGDYANVYGQIWAARGLLDVDSSEAPAAVDFLLSQQCGNGRFLSFFSDTCGGTAPGPDATAFAIILLSEYAGDDADLATALTEATDWLAGWQAANGSLADDNHIANANSTGLGGWAFDVAGLHEEAERAAVWLRALQVPGRACDGKLAGQRGAVAYDKAAYVAGRRNGLQPLTVGQWQTVAAQALPALAHAPATDVALSVAAPARVDAGSRVRLKVRGLAPGERACVGFAAKLKAAVGASDGGVVIVRFRAPRKQGDAVAKVLTANGKATDTTRVR
jgi:hypothetical protein